MPPPSHIPGLDPRFPPPCCFPLLPPPCCSPPLRALGYETRVSINNGVGPGQPHATEMSVSLSAFADDGRHLGTTGELLRLAPGEIAKLDVDRVIAEQLEAPEGNLIGIAHVVPVDLV